jgi:hypothetical protein
MLVEKAAAGRDEFRRGLGDDERARGLACGANCLLVFLTIALTSG